MSSVAYLAAPVLVLLGTWALLTGRWRLGAGALLLAVVLAAAGVATEPRAPAVDAPTSSSA